MRLRLLLCLLGFSVGLFPALAGASEQILVKYEPGVTKTERSEIRSDLQLQVEDRFSLLPRLESLALPESDDLFSTLVDLRQLPEVEYAVRDRVRPLQGLPSDPRFYKQWGLHNTGQLIQDIIPSTAGADIEAEEAWSMGTGSASIRVAVIDTGIDMDHPDLAGNIWTNPGEIPGNRVDDDRNGYVDDVNGWDFADNDNLPEDSTGHGTHVSGIIGARANNGTGVTGVAPNVTLVPLRACSSSGCQVSDTLAALEYAVKNGMRISNNSYGGTGFLEPEYEAIKAATSYGHVFVTSAGNGSASNDDPDTANFPAGYDIPEIVSVAAHTSTDTLASFSNYGNSVDIAAPGKDILSTGWNGQYVWMDGTSMASPFVAGAAALVASRRPSFSASQIISQLLKGREPLAGNWAGKTAGGKLFSAGRAMSVKPVSPVISQAPAQVSAPSVLFAFFAEAGMSFQCSLDGSSWKSCTTGISFTGLAPGLHSFQVRSRDIYGLTSDPTAHSWMVSSVSPPAFSTISPFVSSGVLKISISGGGTISCRLDRAAWNECPSTMTLVGLAAGRHTLEAYRTVDGTRSALASVSWTVDLDAPSGTASKRASKSNYLLYLKASDKTSSVARAELSSAKNRPAPSERGYASVAYARQVTITGPRVPRWIRFTDLAGNRSAWVRVS